MPPFDYVQNFYGVPAELGRRVSVDGRPGVIAADRGHYIGVNFDDEKPGLIRNAHPVSDVEYGEMGTIRRMTRSQERYKKYREVAECYPSFAAFLGVREKGFLEQ